MNIAQRSKRYLSTPKQGCRGQTRGIHGAENCRGELGAGQGRGSAWARSVLILAGWYNLLWGGLVMLFPQALFLLTGADLPRYPQIWQCVGMIVGVYGVGYLIASRNPLRHWPIVLVGLLGKLFGPIGFLVAASAGDLPWAWGLTIITNDLVWWLPFTAILYQAIRHGSKPSPRLTPLREAISGITSHRGATLRSLSAERPLLLVFLRHSGCTFCRETLSDLAATRGEIEALGVRLAIVHMSTQLTATRLMSKYGLEDVHRFSDGSCDLYQAFGLTRGNLSQLFGWQVWMRGIPAMLRGHGVGKLDGDGFRMPGLFLMRRGQILASYTYRTAADRPDYASIAASLKDTAELREDAKAVSKPSVSVGVSSPPIDVSVGVQV